jgi:hypothetical protein
MSFLGFERGFYRGIGARDVVQPVDVAQIYQQPPSTITINPNTSQLVAKARVIGTGTLNARLVYASTNAPRTITGVSLSIVGEEIYLVAGASAALGTYSDFGIEVYVT